MMLLLFFRSVALDVGNWPNDNNDIPITSMENHGMKAKESILVACERFLGSGSGFS
jgi:hypothetical protein